MTSKVFLAARGGAAPRPVQSRWRAAPLRPLGQLRSYSVSIRLSLVACAGVASTSQRHESSSLARMRPIAGGFCTTELASLFETQRKTHIWVRAEGLRHEAQQQLLQQQAEAVTPVQDLQATRVLVETAMFAAVGGLAFSVAAVLKLQSYLGYLLPMPVVLAAMRHGPAVARKTTVATAMLLLVLLGPLQAVSYVLQHGIAAWALGCLWALQVPWWASIVLASIARMSGIVGFLAFTSWTLNENLYRLLVAQIHALLDQMSSIVGASGSPSPLVIQAVMVSVLLVNCVMYIALLHVLYAVLLRTMGYRSMPMPAFLEQRLLPAQLRS